MTEQELFQAILEAEAADSELTKILEKIKNKTATFQDTQRYSLRSAEIRAKILSQHLSPAGSGQNEESCYQLLQDQHKDVNQKAAAVQKILDEKQNLHISPAIAAFPAERVRKAAHSLEDMTVSEDVLRRRAENAVANIAASFHDDYIKENSEFRQKAGLTCHVSRIGAFKCCAWCARLAGRYEKGREPADFWKRHDKCTCQISYETQKLRQRLSGTGRGWKVDSEIRRRQVQAIQYKPARFTREQAQALESQQLSQYRGLTIAGKTGIINSGGKITDKNFMYYEKFEAQAKNFYKARVQNGDSDVKSIAKNTKFSYEDILAIKKHLMEENHLFADGSIHKFTPDIDIALAWQRLMKGNPQDIDILLLNHELRELRYIEKTGCDYETAHRYSNQKYDWEAAIVSFVETDNIDTNLLK